MTENHSEKQAIPEKQGMACDIAVIGSGPAGMLAALALARRGAETALIGRPNKGAETRTTALMMPAIAFLGELCAWEALRPQAAPLRAMRIIDGTKRLIRSPAVEFRSADIGEAAFGYNIPNQALNAVLIKAVAECPHIRKIEAFAESCALRGDSAAIKLADGRIIETRLIVAADGRNSKARAAAGIDVSRRAYPQTALTLSFSHEFPHDSVSTEFHTEEGPFTQVPLIGNRSALVWTVRPERARHLQTLGKEALSREIGARMGFLLGEAAVENLPEAWPMAGLTAKAFAARRVALIGETAHLFPPIGAQGLNLTIRDIMNLSAAAAQSPEDAGADKVLAAYNRRRRPDILFRAGIVHSLNRALLSDFLPVQFIRSGGLELLRRHALLRNLFMREGMAPGIGVKKLLPSFLR